MRMTEDTLVQQTTAEYMKDELGWNSVYAFDREDFGPNSLLGRSSDREVVLTRHLRVKLVEFNPTIPADGIDQAVRTIVESSATQALLDINRDKYELFKNGVQVSFRDSKGSLIKRRVRVFDFDTPECNEFLCVRELWIRGDLYRRRGDIIGFVNGIPLLFVELKNIHRDLKIAYDKNFADYKDTIPHLFQCNAIVMLGNGEQAKIGTISSRYKHFHEWKRLEEDQSGAVDMETLLKGICNKRNFMDLFENFIVFDNSTGQLIKVLGRNHQFLGVNRAIAAVEDRKNRAGKLGVFWHTQGSGKSYSMVFFTRKVHRKLGGNFTFLICTDREDLDSQIYKTFAGCGLADNDKDPCRASSGDSLRSLLTKQKTYIFSLIQKFNQRVDPGEHISQREDIIVITDEAHRSQYGLLALNMHNALPHASYMGFTGTPIFKNDEITRRIFGDYISTYDFQRAVDDGATVPLFYDARGDKLGIATDQINERIAEKLEEWEAEDVDVQQKLERELKRDYHIITAKKRLEQVAHDFVEHYSTSWETGKAMLICIDKPTCVRMHSLITQYWQERINQLESQLTRTESEQDEIYLRRQIEWMRQTLAAVVISEEQGEVDTFRKWDLDILPHRRLIKEGFSLADGTRLDLDSAFKKEAHPFRIAIVCAMWLTGFDVPCLTNLYLDKPLKAHTLMQAIARANRVNEGKENGLIVDYCGILKNLRKALATFAGYADAGHGAIGDIEVDPTKPSEELLEDLAESIQMVRAFLTDNNASLESIIATTGFGRNAAIVKAKEAANQSDETRKRFEVMARAVFSKFKASLNEQGVNRYRSDYEAINIVYKSLQNDRELADISDILRQLQATIDDAITIQPTTGNESREVYDISRIDFDRLRKEFELSPSQNTAVQNLRQAIEQRVARMLQQNPTRTDYQRHYEQIVSDYNREKDRPTIEATFEALMRFMKDLSEEDTRDMREGLDKETLAMFDLLRKPDLSDADIRRIKQIAVDLLTTLKKEKLKIDHWREKETTRDAVLSTITNFLWSDQTGLPDSYTQEDVENKSRDVYRHIYNAYPTLPSPYYSIT
jgi:type I restriction enzyme R subunit